MYSDFSGFSFLKDFAILGGTFDPIHIGHLFIAESVRQAYDLEKIIFIPSGNPPHKDDYSITNKKHRYLMTVLATLSNDYFEVSNIEYNKETPTYTIDTIKEIKSICDKDANIYFIIGADSLFELHTWKNYKELIEICQFIVVGRGDFSKADLIKRIESLKKEYEAKISYLDIPVNEISSTTIRNYRKANRSIKYLVCENVEKYIYKYGLYSPEDELNKLDFSLISNYLKENLSKYRYNHTLSVAKTAEKLGKRYNIEPNKAYIAGLLHDIGKEIPNEEALIMCNELGIKLLDMEKENPHILHGYIGAEIAKDLFGIKDDNILNAIRYHTTGRKNMSQLEKVVFIADKIEPQRKNQEYLDFLSNLAYNDINRALISYWEYNNKKIEKSGGTVHPFTIEALDYYKKTIEDN